MIKLKKTGRYSIDFKVDEQGLDILLKALEEKSDNISFQAEFDRSILNFKNTKIESRNMRFVVDDNIDGSEFCETDGTIIWMLDHEDYDWAETAFRQCKDDGCFFPAEFIDVRVKKNNRIYNIYCEYVDTSDF